MSAVNTVLLSRMKTEGVLSGAFIRDRARAWASAALMSVLCVPIWAGRSFIWKDRACVGRLCHGMDVCVWSIAVRTVVADIFCVLGL